MSVEANELLRLVLFAFAIAGMAIAWVFDWRMSRRIKKRSILSPMSMMDMVKTTEFYVMMFGVILAIASVFSIIHLTAGK